MAKTNNLGLVLPTPNDIYSIKTVNKNNELIDKAIGSIEEVKKHIGADNLAGATLKLSEKTDVIHKATFDVVSTTDTHIANTRNAPMMLTGWLSNLFDYTIATSSNASMTPINDVSFKVVMNEANKPSAQVQVRVDCKPNTTYTIAWKSSRTGSDGGGILIRSRDLQTAILEKISTLDGIFTFNSGNTDGFVISLYAVRNDSAEVRTAIFEYLTLVEGKYESLGAIPFGSYEVTASGNNLIPFPYATANNTVTGGITFTYNEDGSIKLTGTPTGNGYYHLYGVIADGLRKASLFDGEVTLSIDDPTVELQLWGITTNDASREVVTYPTSSSTGLNTVTFNASKYKYMCIRLKTTTATHTDITVHPKIEFGSVATPYEQYKGSKVTVGNDVKAPVFGLESYEGITHIYNSTNAPINLTYANTEAGKYILQSMRDIDELKSAIVALSTVNV